MLSDSDDDDDNNRNADGAGMGAFGRSSTAPYFPTKPAPRQSVPIAAAVLPRKSLPPVAAATTIGRGGQNASSRFAAGGTKRAFEDVSDVESEPSPETMHDQHRLTNANNQQQRQPSPAVNNQACSLPDSVAAFSF